MSQKEDGILLDVDGCLLWWLQEWFEWVEATKGFRPIYEAKDHNNYDLAVAYPQVRREVVYGWVSEFNVSDFFSMINPVPGAVEAVKDMRSEFPDFSIVIVTAPGSAPKTVMNRALNLRIFEQYVDEVHILGLHASKQHIFSRFSNRSVLIDDNPKYLAEADRAGIQPLCFGWEFNRGHDPRIESWDEAVSAVRRLINKANDNFYAA